MHLNPVRVSELKTPSEERKMLDGYYWSSHQHYTGRRKKLAAACETALGDEAKGTQG